jgi:hypothetical protein
MKLAHNLLGGWYYPRPLPLGEKALRRTRDVKWLFANGSQAAGRMCGEGWAEKCDEPLIWV